MLVSAPSFLRELALKVKPELCVAACAAIPQDDEKNPVLASLKTTLRLLARSWNAVDEELRELDKQLVRLSKLAAPRLLGRFGVGPQTAATLLVTAADNPTRLRNETALAALCGASPLEASSGKKSRHRLNRGGQRQTNNIALHARLRQPNHVWATLDRGPAARQEVRRMGSLWSPENRAKFNMPPKILA